MKKSNYDHRPEVLVRHENGTAIFRWGIEEVTSIDMDGTQRTSYNCNEVWVTDASENKVTEAAIDALWGKGVEQKLQNDYNAAKEGVFTGQKATECIDAYVSFLRERQSLKSEVASAYNSK